MLNLSFIGALNGVIGDYLHQTKNPLSINMGLYHNETPIQTDLSKIQSNYPNSNRNVCLFLHGAASIETHWNKNATINYAESLYNKYNYLPLFVRYNSGLHISENGKQLNSLLKALCAVNSIDDIVIIGHSMGGLVFRSAVFYAHQYSSNWVKKVKHAFYLGSPHQGAPLEKFGAFTQSILEKIPNPYTKATHKLINIRSNGIKDLRHGYLRDEEWLAEKSDAFPTNRKTEVSSTFNFNQYVVAATVAKNIDSLLSLIHI